MTEEEAKKADQEKLDAALRLLVEHFDTVQIFVTRYAPEFNGTINLQANAGSYFARYGQAKLWVEYQEEVQRTEAWEDMEEDG